MRYLFVLFLSYMFFNPLAGGQSDYHLVFIHIGKELPAYIETSIAQARLFNGQCPIYLIANQEAVQKLPEGLTADDVQIVTIENLKKSEEHEAFLKDYPPSKYRDGFWTYTIERFLYLDDLLTQLQLENVFHLENDVMVYTDFQALLPIFRANYKGIAATFDNDQRCIPGLFFIQDRTAMRKLAKFFASHAKLGKNDMELVALFEKENDSQTIDYLPIIMDSYRNSYALISPAGHQTKHPERFSNHYDSFLSIFDAAALGQYLGGIDRRNANVGTGFINESCVVNPSRVKIFWEKDMLGRRIPIAEFEGQKCRINNLHVHSKMLESFSSRPKKEAEKASIAGSEHEMAAKVYVFANDPIDVIIPSTEKDKDTLALCIAGIKENCRNIRRVIVVSSNKLTDEAEWFDEKKYPFSKYDVALEIFHQNQEMARRHNMSWFYQQLLKLYAPYVIPGISSNVLILDSDTIFLKPVDFVDAAGAGYLNPGTEYHQPYFVHIDKLIPGLKKYSTQDSGISHHMLFQKVVLDDLFKTIESKHKVPAWKAFCRCVDLSQSFFAASEYELYFNFVLSRNDQVKIRPLKWANTSKLKDLQRFKDEGYDYISCHSWMRDQAAKGIPHP